MNKLAVFVVVLAIGLLVPLDRGVILDEITRRYPQNEDIVMPEYKQISRYLRSVDTRIHAWILYPIMNENPTQKPPIVIMGHGIGSQKDFGLLSYAEKFVEAGIAVMLIDYRTFGGSDGTPRNLIDPWKHVEDFRSAIQHVIKTRGIEGRVDPEQIALWGTSFGGGHVLTVASQLAKEGKLDQIKAVISQVPHLNGKSASLKAIKSRGPLGTLRFAVASLQDLARSAIGLSPVYVKIAGRENDLALMPMNQEDLSTYASKIPNKPLGGWRNQACARVGLQMRFYNPIEYIKETPIDVPVLLVAGKKDDLCPPELVKESSQYLNNEKTKVLVPDCTHFEVYANVDVKTRMVSFMKDVFDLE